MEKSHKNLDILKKINSRIPTPLILAIIIPAAICLYLYSTHFRAAGLFHDDGIYIVNAKSLYEGTGYRIASLPDSPPQTKYPPVFPLILSLLWHINPSFPENIHLMRLFSALCAVLVLPLAWRYLRLKSSYKMFTTFLFLSALALNPYFAFFAGQVMAEMPFTLFSLASIVLFLHYERHGGKTSLFCSFLLAVIAFYTRTIGAALFLSFLLWFLCQQRFKAAFLLSGITLAAAIPWFYWVSMNAPATNSLVTAYYSSYLSWFLLAIRSSSFSYVPDLLGFSLPGLLCPLIGVYPATVSTILSIIFAVFFFLFFLKGILYQLRKSPSVDTFYLLITVTIVAVWSQGWDATRFLLPVLPIVLFHVMEGIRAVREDVITLSLPYRNVTRPLWQLGVAVLLVGIFAVPLPRATGLIRESHYNSEALFRCYEESGDWIKNNTGRGDVIASPLDPLVYLLSGRCSVNVTWLNPLDFRTNPINTYDEDDILEAFKKYRISHLLAVYIERADDGMRNKKLSEIIMKYPDAFHLLHKKEGLFAIYRVKSQYL